MNPIYRIKIRHNKYFGVDVILEERCTILWIFNIWLIVKIRRGVVNHFETTRIANAWINAYGSMKIVYLAK